MFQNIGTGPASWSVIVVRMATGMMYWPRLAYIGYSDARITIHLNQIWGEVAAVRAHRNRLPTEYLADLGFLNDRIICAHCRCMEPSEEKLLGEAKVNVSFNSAIAARRGLSPRVADLEKYGCNIGMGSDNMAEDMVEVMRTGLVKDDVMYVQAGVGVVADSDLEAEYQESVQKARALVRAAEEAVRFASAGQWSAGNTRR